MRKRPTIVSRSGVTALAAAALALLYAPGSAGAGVMVWTPLGPGGGTVTGLAADPRDPSTVFAAAPAGGVFKSGDGGRTWARATQFGPQVVAVGPDGTVLAGSAGAIWRSADGGASWQAIVQPPTTAGPLSASRFAFDPRRPQTVYAAAGSGYAIYQSIDSGAHWASLDLVHPPGGFGSFMGAVAVSPRRPGLLLAGGALGILRTVDGGASWALVTSACQVQALLFDPQQPARVYAGCRTDPGTGAPLHSVLVSNNHGITWRPADAGLELMEVGDLVTLPGRAGRPSTVLAATGAGVFITTDAGTHWVRAGGGIDHDGVAALAVTRGPGAMPALLAGTRFGGVPGTGGAVGEHGILRSDDGGGTWSRSDDGLAAVAINALAADPSGTGRLFAGSAFEGVLRTRSGGASWRRLDDSVTTPIVAHLAVAPTTPATVYAADWLGIVAASRDAGRTWSALQLPPTPGFREQHTVYGPAVDPLDARHLLLGGFGLIYESRDGGISWSVVGIDPSHYFVAFAFASPAIFAASIRLGSPDAFPYSWVWKSLDGGATWTKSVLTFDPYSTYVGVLAADPFDPATTYAGAQFGLYRSTDGGSSWKLAGLAHHDIRTVVPHPQLPGVLFAGGFPDGSDTPLGSAPVWVSRDRGDSWAPLGDGLPPQGAVSALVIDPVDPSRLYAAALGGVYTLTWAPP